MNATHCKVMQLIKVVCIISIFLVTFIGCSKVETKDTSSATVNTLKVTAAPSWYSDGRCFLRGASGAFDGVAVKDPSIVYSGGKWHMFYTGKDANSWRMGYASSTLVSGLKTASHVYMSSLNAGSYFCAPQVFYFGVKGKWFLIYQNNGACFSTNTDVSNPSGWTPVRQMFAESGVDYWCISDGTNVYCFWSPDANGIIKRKSTTVANFPYGWGATTTVCSNTFEAPHVYKNKADGKYYMMVEDVSRHFELWTCGTNLGGTFTQVNENWAIASRLTQNNEHWTDQVSHGEILRSTTNELMEIDNIDHCQILIQGVTTAKSSGVAYGLIPYELGLIRNYQ